MIFLKHQSDYTILLAKIDNHQHLLHSEVHGIWAQLHIEMHRF